MVAHLISSINLLQSFVASSGTFGIQISVIAVSFQNQHFDQFWKTEKLLKAVKAWLSSYRMVQSQCCLWFLLRPLWGNFQLWRWSGKSLQRQTSKSAPGCHRPVSDIVTPTAIQVLLHYLSSIFSTLSTPHCNVESVALKEKSSPWRSLIYQSVEITENRKFYEISELVPIHFRQIQEPPISTKWS